MRKQVACPSCNALLIVNSRDEDQECPVCGEDLELEDQESNDS